MGSAFEVDRNVAGNIVYECQLVRGLYQHVTVGNLEFANDRFPGAGIPQSQDFSVAYEPRDILRRIDASKVVAITDGGTWAEKKVREELGSKYEWVFFG